MRCSPSRVDFEEERAEVGDDGGHVGHRPDGCGCL